MFLNILCCLIMLMMSLLSVAFLTLLERKILSYIQIRKGPSKVGIQGIFQPFSDAIKLYSKEFFIPLKINMYPYWLSPIFSLVVMCIVWIMFPYFYLVVSWKYSLLFMFCVISLGVYGVMVSGWSSNSCYSILGGIRSVAQSVSYEVSFFLMILCLLFFSSSLSLLDFTEIQEKVWGLMYTFPIFIMLVVSFLAELNRSPFDFSEGESELVSGFNVEYGGSGFAFIFLAEYLSILFASMFICMMFMGGGSSTFLFYLKLTFVSFFIILVRGSLPRYRYDKLMNLCWKSYLMVVLNMILFYGAVVNI
uniref:NADH dehydrogenase subunit 1 n=1 Tax=Psyllopsis discrepans TaxID=2283586 RepID=UPI002A81DF5F|nr:NADH dehydrogenase subunit 1 [Psyllopsis discrepans]WON66121.1 NADH dehydrogenase subunit 1 [Psyllopsis discrepans]